MPNNRHRARKRIIGRKKVASFALAWRGLMRRAWRLHRRLQHDADPWNDAYLDASAGYLTRRSIARRYRFLIRRMVPCTPTN
jgi:hypothetical protein